MRGKRLTQQLFCAFTQEELDAKGLALAMNTLERDKLDEERKSAAGNYREQIADLDGVKRKLSNEIRAKGENRPVDCIAKFHDPEPGLKTIVRLDSGEIVRTGVRISAACWARTRST